MSCLQVSFYLCPECQAQWEEFRIGPRECPECKRHLEVERGGLDRIYSWPVSKDVPEGCLFTLNEVGL